MNIDVFSVTDKAPKDIVYVLLNSVKNSRDKDDTVIFYHLFVQDLDDSIKEYFSDLESDDFHLILYNARDYQNRINPPKKTYLYYLRCLAPSLFPTLDRVLYLDTDTIFINSGLEKLWQTKLDTKYVGAVLDIEIHYNDCKQRSNVLKMNSETYFNTGVMLMNLKQIREQGMDKQIEQYLISWPSKLRCILYDQTLLNYVFKNQVKIISSKWNNSVLAMLLCDQKAYKEYYQTDNLLNTVKDAVILHLKGPKPWSAVSAGVQYNQIYRKVAQDIYGEIYKQLGKHEEF